MDLNGEQAVPLPETLHGRVILTVNAYPDKTRVQAYLMISEVLSNSIMNFDFLLIRIFPGKVARPRDWG